MARSATFEQITRQPNGSYVGHWGDFVLRSAFQPIFAFRHGKMEIAAYEGLIRPFLADAPVRPGEFFGSIRSIERFGIETLTRTLHVMNAPLVIGNARLFINFDPSVFQDRSISKAALDDLKLVLHEADVHPDRIVCELTEHRSGSEEALFSFARALHDNGFVVALDDYGADDSDFARVRTLRPRIIKFDGAWIVRLSRSKPGMALLKAMVDSFHDMGIKIVFEGLETLQNIDAATECGADFFQGFALARPELVAIGEADDPMLVEPASDLEPAPITPNARPASRAPRAFGRRATL